jgi:hypothetical protein
MLAVSSHHDGHRLHGFDPVGVAAAAKRLQRQPPRLIPM